MSYTTYMSDDVQICVIEPRPEVAPALSGLLQIHGLRVRSFHNPQQFMSDAACQTRCCVLIDACGNDLDLPALLEQLREQPFSGSIIILTSDSDKERQARLRQMGATDAIARRFLAAFMYTRLGDLLPGARGLPELESHAVPLRNGTEVTYRLMRPEDADIEQAFVRSLSDRSRYLRFFATLKELPDRMLDELTHPQFPISYAIIATVIEQDREKQIAVGRYAPTAESGLAEYAVVVGDDWQGQGIATQLMHGIILVCSLSGFKAVEGIILRENRAMINLAKKLGFEPVKNHFEGPGVVKLRKLLNSAKTESLD